MLADLVLLQRSGAGEVRLYDSRDKFHACFVNGEWSDTLEFQDYELDDFTLIEDEAEILKVLAVAREALNSPLDSSSENQAKSA